MAGRTCSVEDCEGKHYGHGLCNKHWHRWRKHGDPQFLVRGRGTHWRRFWERVDKNGPIARNVPTLGRCWLWTAGTIRGGYGQFWPAPTAPVTAHRWLFQALYGPIPPPLQLDHFACDNPPCVNPAHVKPVTPRENTMRSNSVSAVNARKMYCKRGHPLFGDNLMNSPVRLCKACRRLRYQEKGT